MAKSNKSEYQSIPGYEVLRKSGCNLGVAYLARQSSTGRLVTLKVFRKGEFFSEYGKDQLGRQAWFFMILF